ncbi:MAG: DNA helicase UvrD, partial [Bacteroidales bacterium]|nr:DNA helicase UvrD [Bacteroidales bacterium]
QAAHYRQFLAGKIASVQDRGWFPADASRVRNELTIIDTDGNEHRPDRVVVTPTETLIVDFKFGEESPAYRGQVRRYERLYREMGYPAVRGYLWYIREEGADKIVEV